MSKNYKDTNNRQSLLDFKNNVIKQLSTSIDNGIQKNGKDYKRAALLTYWLKDFTFYYNNENNFNSKKLLRYERGNIIKVNLGFNVGSEQGGQHYAVVIEKHNKLSNPNLNVVPLISKKENKIIKQSEVDIGSDLYSKMSDKSLRMENSLSEEVENLRNENDMLGDTLNRLNILIEEFHISDNTVYDNLKDRALLIDEKIKNLENQIFILKNVQNEINKMKLGSIACVGQITTISKMRIYDPKSSNGVLYDIKLSNDSMDKINKKICELFIH